MRIINLLERPSCLEQISQWHYDEWGTLYPHETLADFHRDLEDALCAQSIPGTWLLLDDNDNILGTASVLKHDMTSHQELSPWLANVFIQPDLRGAGLGKKLVLAVMDEIGKAGIRQLYLFTDNQRTFYERLGWELLEETSYEGKRVDVMTCCTER